VQPEQTRLETDAGAREALRRLTVLFLSMEYPPETGGGGIGSYVAVQARALAARGHDVHVLSCVFGQDSRDYLDEGVHVHRRGQMRVRGLTHLMRETGWRLKTALSCYRELRRLGLQPDVIEAPDWAAEGFVVALRRSAPLVVHLHSPLTFIYRGNGVPMDLDARFADRLERFTARRAHVVTSPSEFIVDELNREGWLNGRDVRVLHHPIDLERWTASRGAEETRPIVLTVGRVEPRKSPEVVVRAAARLLDSVEGLELVFLGRSNYDRDGRDYRDWVAELAKEAGVPCTFLDPVPRDDLRRWYDAARVVVLPGSYDNFPMAGLEAMAAARPLVCTESMGLAELLRGSDAGGTFDAGSEEQLAEALRRFLIDPGAAGLAGRAATELVRERSAPRQVTLEREEVYATAIRLAGGRDSRGGR
jgi:glycogen synthase